jgi:hypothetical protein
MRLNVSIFASHVWVQPHKINKIRNIKIRYTKFWRICLLNTPAKYEDHSMNGQKMNVPYTTKKVTGI